MNHSTITQALIRKEVRQVLPLALAVLACGLGIDLLLVSSAQATSGLVYTVAAATPLLFSIGVGALLVGQEKESRTLQWLASLPIPTRTLVGTKLAVAFAFLGILIVISFLQRSVVYRYVPFDALDDMAVHGIASMDLLVVSCSAFVLALGFAIAWRLKPSLMSLAIIPAAVFVVSNSMNALFVILLGEPFDRYGFDQFMPWPAIGFAIFACLALAYSWRASHRYFSGWYALGATSSSVRAWIRDWGWSRRDRPNGNASNSASTTRVRTRPWVWQTDAPQPPMAALVRQVGIQNGVAFAVLGFAIAICSVVYISMMERTTSDNNVQLILTIAGLSICWMGVVAFHGDRQHARIRFLADRGVSPGRIWLTRHIYPLAIFMAIAGAVTTAIALTGNPIYDPKSSHWSILVIAYGVCLFGLASLYGFNQWVGQWIGSTILAAIIAPPLTFCVIAFALYMRNQMESPLWVFAVCSLWPFLATYWTMKSWMDSGRSLRFHSTHAAFAVGVVVLPWLVFHCEPLWVGGVPSAVRDQWKKYDEIARLKPTEEGIEKRPWMKRWIASSDEESGVIDNEKPHPVIESLAHRVEDYLEFEVWRFNGDTEINAVQNLPYFRSLALNSKDSKDLQIYRTILTHLLDKHRLSRLELNFQSNDRADFVERALLREILHPKKEQLLSPELNDRITALLRDTKARDDARKSVIAYEAIAWQNSPTRLSEPNSSLVYYQDLDILRSQTLNGKLLWKARQERILLYLWELVDAKTQAQSEAAHKGLDEFLGVTHVALRSWDGNDVVSNPRELRHPGIQWNQGWEAIAASLPESSPNPDSPSKSLVEPQVSSEQNNN